MITRLFLVAAAGLLAVTALAVPTQAAHVTRVEPSDGKWAGLRDITSCDSVTSPDITDASSPDELDCASPVSGTTEAVDFRIANRRITTLSFDIVIQCHPSDADHWTATTMSFRSAPGWSYSPMPAGSRTVTISPRGLLRLAIPVEETIGYPAGQVLATFDFRGASAKTSLFYQGTYTEPGYSNHCVSQENVPSVIPVRKRA